MASADDIEAAVAAADRVRGEFAAAPAHVRAGALDHVSRRLAERTEEIARLITAETGKPLKWARLEVARAVSTFRWARRGGPALGPGRLQRLDTDPGRDRPPRAGAPVRRGPVLGIAPFNFPLNLVAHKVAPAIAVGAPIVLKPAPATPLSALVLGEILAETDLPAGSWSVLPVPNDRSPPTWSRDPRLPVVSFTGSVPGRLVDPRLGAAQARTLELGGNAAVVVAPDQDDDGLAYAASRIATFAMYQAGQSCISVQRVFAHRDVAAALAERVVEAVRGAGHRRPDRRRDRRRSADRRAGRPAGGDLGGRGGGRRAPAAHRRHPRRRRVRAHGARRRPADAKVACEEVFGPVVVLDTVDSVDEAFAAVNDAEFGLQAGVFTRDLQLAFRAARELEVGGVIVGDVPSFRADQMPYGGLKDSGVGREGVRSAMEDSPRSASSCSPASTCRRQESMFAITCLMRV